MSTKTHMRLSNGDPYDMAILGALEYDNYCGMQTRYKVQTLDWSKVSCKRCLAKKKTATQVRKVRHFDKKKAKIFYKRIKEAR